MYCKLFASLYQGTLRGRAHQILVFTNLLAHADRDGFVDKHFKAISEEVGLTQDEVRAAVLELEAPDPESRSQELGGARLERIDDHRIWGWRIVNYRKYRNTRDEEDRRVQNREAQARWRARNAERRQAASSAVSHDKPRSAHAEAEAEALVDYGSQGSDGAFAPASPSREIKNGQTNQTERHEAEQFVLPLSESDPQPPSCAAPPSPRPRSAAQLANDALLCALAGVESGLPVKTLSSVESRRHAAALKQIRAITPEVTPEEIHRRASHWETHFRDATLSSTAIAKWWRRLGDAAAPTKEDIRLGRLTDRQRQIMADQKAKAYIARELGAVGVSRPGT